MENAAPTERSRKARRSIPVPAGSGCPGSIAGSPRPAAATPRRRRWARLKSLQEQPCGHRQLTCRSGAVAINMRSAFWRSARKGLSSHSAVTRPSRHDSAKAAMHSRDSADSSGSAQ